jgi:hypothetical protein
MRRATERISSHYFEQEYIRDNKLLQAAPSAARRRMLGRFRRMHGSPSGCSGSLFSRLRDPEGRLQVAAFGEALQKLG